MSPHHEAEALLHDFDIDTTLEAENEQTDGVQKQPYKTMVMTEENLKNHQKQEVGHHRNIQ